MSDIHVELINFFVNNTNNHIKYNQNGLLIPTDNCPKELLDDIYQYFYERNEDE